MNWMKEAYRLTRKDGAPGIDGVTATIYEANLEANLRDEAYPVHSGSSKCSVWARGVRRFER
jgi:RNA-directed DNA polymerase